jgi:hypothetical protein
MLYKRHPLVLIDSYDHKDRGGDADKGVCTEACWAAMEGALKPDQRADNERTRHSADDYQVFVSHRSAPVPNFG